MTGRAGTPFSAAGRSKSLLEHHTKGPSLAGTIPQAFDEIDVNHDGVIDRAEWDLAKIKAPERQTQSTLPIQPVKPTEPGGTHSTSSLVARELAHRFGLPYEELRKRAIATEVTSSLIADLTLQ